MVMDVYTFYPIHAGHHVGHHAGHHASDMSTRESVMLFVIFVFLVLLPIMMSMVGLGFGVRYMDVRCDESAPFSLATWLFGSVGVGMLSFVLGLVLSFFVVKRKTMNVMCVVTSVVVHGCAIIWGTVGLVYLVMDASDCKNVAFPLWITTILTFAGQWICFIVNLVMTFVLYYR